MATDAPLEDICRRLIHDANARGGFDNVTVVLLRVVDEGDEGDETRPGTLVVVDDDALDDQETLSDQDTKVITRA